MPGLEVQSLHAGYLADVMILQGIDLTAQAGRITAVLGANGVGKSTLLKTIGGFLRAARGRVVWDGRDLTRVSPWELPDRRIAFIPQGRSVFPYLSVEENLALGCWSFRHDSGRVRAGITHSFSRFPLLAGLRRRQAGNLSGGQQRLLELARALLIDPALLLVDEPTAGLAPAVTDEIYRSLRELRDRDAKTILLVDQNVRKALEIADHVYVLELGRNKLDAPPADLARLGVERWLL
jgi:branched-chain amino acid transport system ATP-binding protein